MSPETHTELLRLLSGLCDDRLGGPDRARLEELLEADADCRRVYLEYLDVHARLLFRPELGAIQPARPREQPAGRRYRRLARYGLVIGGTLAASLLIQLAIFGVPGPRTHDPVSVARRAPTYVATLIHAADCVWEDPAEAPPVGARLLPGDLRLRKGVARVRFDSGPVLTLEGPTVIRIESGKGTTLVAGTVLFKDDDMSGAFELRTPRATLLDVGTEYAVEVDARGDEEVHVFDGEVSRVVQGQAGPQTLARGVARRYGSDPMGPGEVRALDAGRFKNLQLAGLVPGDPAAGLLAFEGFAYVDPGALQAGTANGGRGWDGPWQAGFARPLNEGDTNLNSLNVREGLAWPGARVPAVGGCFDYTGFTKYFRRLATPIRMDTDAVYFLSFLFRRHGPPADPLNAVAILLRPTDELEAEIATGKGDPARRFNVGVDQVNTLFTYLARQGARTPLPLRSGETYLMVAKVVASRSHPDQTFVRVYAADEPIDPEEPGAWSVVGPPVDSDLSLEWLQVHINSKTRQSIDEVRVGTTWPSVTAPWARKAGKP